MIIGLDEAGRGAWAGPLTAAAVLLPDEASGFFDSKSLSHVQRVALSQAIRQQAVALGIGWVQPQIIDAIGLEQAVQRAMFMAISSLSQPNAAIVIDGRINYLADSHPQAQPIIKADSSVQSVSAASIVAKVARDHYMMRLDHLVPGYDFALHKGYGTKHHQERLAQHGPSNQHRFSYKPIQRYHQSRP